MDRVLRCIPPAASDDSFDRPPCGAGCSALLACLAADGQITPDETLIEESAMRSRYRLSFRSGPNGGVTPTIQGQAWVTADAQRVFMPGDPFECGVQY